jgi:hypothetical protein
METSDMTFIRGTFPIPQLYVIRVNSLFNQEETKGFFSAAILSCSAALAVIPHHKAYREPKTVLPVVFGNTRTI